MTSQVFSRIRSSAALALALAVPQLTYAAVPAPEASLDALALTAGLAVGPVAAHGPFLPFGAPSAAWSPRQTRAWHSYERALALQRGTPGALQGGVAQSGEMVITEFMKDPSAVLDTRGEWIEFYNALPWRVNMEGWALADDGGSLHVIDTGGAGLRQRPGRYLVLGNNGDPTLNGGVTLDYVYSGFSLSNTSDQIVLQHADGTVIDRVAYDSSAWPSIPGKASALRNDMRNVVANDDGANWCAASTPLVAGGNDTGTPKLVNDACP